MSRRSGKARPAADDAAAPKVSSTRPTLVHRIHIRASAEEVWRAITDPLFTEQYFYGLSVRSDWKMGARIVYESLAGGPHMVGTLLEVDPPRRLSFSVRVLRDEETAADLPSRVTWELEPAEGGCNLTVVHDEFEAETPTYRTVEGGWPLALEGLRELLETGKADDSQRAWPGHLDRPPPFAGA